MAASGREWSVSSSIRWLQFALTIQRVQVNSFRLCLMACERTEPVRLRTSESEPRVAGNVQHSALHANSASKSAAFCTLTPPLILAKFRQLVHRVFCIRRHGCETQGRMRRGPTLSGRRRKDVSVSLCENSTLVTIA